MDIVDFLRYKGENYYLDKNKNLDNFTMEDAIKTFGWDRKKKYLSM